MSIQRDPRIGCTGRDKVTGFTGLIMGVTQYLTGCSNILLTPTELDKEGKRREGEWFDELRVEVLADSKLVLDATNKNGCDECSAPTK